MYTVLAAAFAAAAVALPAGNGNGINTPEPANPFYIRAEVTSGNANLNGRYLQYFHTGAGEATLVSTTTKEGALKFYTTDDHRLASFSSSSLPPSEVNFANQAPYLSDAPAGYDLITFDMTAQGAPGFGLVHNAGGPFYVGYDNSNADFKGWALCEVNGTSPYFSVGPQVQLLWKTAEATEDSKCACINLAIESA